MSKNIALLFLAFIITSGYIICTIFVLSGRVETSDPNHLLMIGQALGGIQGMAGMVISYFFGTTKGSEEKNSATSDLIAKLPVAPSTKTVEATITTNPTAKETP